MKKQQRKISNFDVFSFTVCNVSHVTSQHLPLIIPCLLLINPTTCLSEFHVPHLVFSTSLQLHHNRAWLVPLLWPPPSSDERGSQKFTFQVGIRHPFEQLRKARKQNLKLVRFCQWGWTCGATMASQPRGFWEHKRSSV